MPRINVLKRESIDVRYLQAECCVRYWEDAILNGEEDTDGKIPCRCGDVWAPLIDLDSGKILNWTDGIEADIHYKVCDAGKYSLLDENKKIVQAIEGYVPDIMCPEGAGYGDYVIMKVGRDGVIQNWEISLDAFEDEEP